MATSPVQGQDPHDPSDDSKLDPVPAHAVSSSPDELDDEGSGTEDEDQEPLSVLHVLTAATVGVLVAGVVLAAAAVVLKPEPVSSVEPVLRYQPVEALCDHVDISALSDEPPSGNGTAQSCTVEIGDLVPSGERPGGPPLVTFQLTAVLTVNTYLRSTAAKAQDLFRDHLDEATTTLADDSPERVKGVGQGAFEYVTDELSDESYPSWDGSQVLVLVVWDSNLLFVLEHLACDCDTPAELRKTRAALRTIARTTMAGITS